MGAAVRAVVRRAPEPKYASRLEADWAGQLELRRRGGDLRHWGYEEATLRLATGARYTPDFLVITAAGEVEFHECKGHMREAARVRILVAASQLPWLRFVLVRRIGVQWTTEEVPCS